MMEVITRDKVKTMMLNRLIAPEEMVVNTTMIGETTVMETVNKEITEVIETMNIDQETTEEMEKDMKTEMEEEMVEIEVKEEERVMDIMVKGKTQPIHEDPALLIIKAEIEDKSVIRIEEVLIMDNPPIDRDLEVIDEGALPLSFSQGPFAVTLLRKL